MNEMENKFMFKTQKALCAALLLVTICLATLVALPAANAATVQLQYGVFPDETYVHEDGFIRNDNGLEQVMPGTGSGILVGSHPGSGDTPAPGHLRGLLEFDLAPIAAELAASPIMSVTLTIPMQSRGAVDTPRVDGAPKVDIHSYGFPILTATSSWVDPDGNGDPLTGDATPGGTVGTFLGTFGVLTPESPIEQSISGGAGSPLLAALEAALAGNMKLGLIMVEDQADTATRDIAFFGSAGRSADQRPLLTIEYEAAPTVAGDFNGDGNVDGADFVIWQTNFPNNSGEATLASGDANGDGNVDGADFVVWQTNFPTTSGAGVAPVPEPSAAMLAIMFAAVALFWRVGKRVVTA